MITEHQRVLLMKTFQSTGSVSVAALKAGMHRETAGRLLQHTVGAPVALTPRSWRTRADPLAGLWPAALEFLQVTPELEAKALFEYLLSNDLPVPENGHQLLRTFQRRVMDWRREFGPAKEVIFAQIRIPGEVLQIDWTHADDLGITIAGVPFDHLLCQGVLPYSNWQYAQPCLSESGLSLNTTFQGAYAELGCVTLKSQTDNSSTATHTLKRGLVERGFNTEYLALCKHYHVEPVAIAIRCPNQNGDIESQQGHLKKRLRNHLALRGSKDFKTLDDYAQYILRVCQAANQLRLNAVKEEIAVMRALPRTPYPTCRQLEVRVSEHSTVRVKGCVYSVPSRLIGSYVQAQLRETTVTFRYNQKVVAEYPRTNDRHPRIDYRHVITSLQRKPGAFLQYVYREEMFPRMVFRQAYDQLCKSHPTSATKHYLEVLGLAASGDEDQVAEILACLLREGLSPQAKRVKEMLLKPSTDLVETVVPFPPHLSVYDSLLTGGAL
jgi:hypothetical protein